MDFSDLFSWRQLRPAIVIYYLIAFDDRSLFF
jgi:hypothetical protein